jgi:hypothetical protein
MQIQKADGSVETRLPGQPVPEAKSWKNLKPWLQSGAVVLVPDGEELEYPKAAPAKIVLNHGQTLEAPAEVVAEPLAEDDTAKKKAKKKV